MTYFRESESEEGPYFDIDNKHIPHDMAEEFYKTGMMNPSSKKDYELNKTTIDKSTKRFVGLIKSIRNSQDDYNF
jgi:hypothetical protein